MDMDCKNVVDRVLIDIVDVSEVGSVVFECKTFFLSQFNFKVKFVFFKQKKNVPDTTQSNELDSFMTLSPYLFVIRFIRRKEKDKIGDISLK